MGGGLQIRLKFNIGLRQKIWLTITFISFFAIILGIGLTFYLYESFYIDKQREVLLQQGQQLAEAYKKNGESNSFQNRLEWTDQNSDAEIIFTDDPMKLSADLPFEEIQQDTFITFEERQKLLNNETVVMVRQHPMFERKILATVIPLLDGDVLKGTIFLYMPLENIYEPFESIRLILGLSLLVIFILIISIGRNITGRIIQPLKEMENISEKMASGDFSQRIHSIPSDEVGSLAKTFNKMSASLSQVEVKRREFLQNVSHELRTPLSYMKGYTGAILDGVVNEPDDIYKYVNITNREINRLSRLVNDLLDLAQLEGDSYPMNKSPIPFAQLVSDVTDRSSLRLEQKGIHLKMNLDEEAIVLGDSDRLEQVVHNILDNSIRYTDREGTIEVQVQQNEEYTKLVIKDNGRGIPEADLSSITERFYRVDKPRTRNEGGVGLGLAIVQQILAKHEAEFHIDSELGVGTAVTLTLPSFDIDSV